MGCASKRHVHQRSQQFTLSTVSNRHITLSKVYSSWVVALVKHVWILSRREKLNWFSLDRPDSTTECQMWDSDRQDSNSIDLINLLRLNESTRHESNPQQALYPPAQIELTRVGGNSKRSPTSAHSSTLTKTMRGQAISITSVWQSTHHNAILCAH